MRLLPAIEDGHVVLHLAGALDKEGAATVARLIGQSMGDFALDFTEVEECTDRECLEIVEQAIRRCPYHLSLRGAARLS